MLKIGIYGGSFDPVHNDHISICKKFHKDFGLDFVLVIPAKVSPFKNGTGASEISRLEMLKIACENSPELIPCDIELSLEGKSYTYRTVSLLREKYPDAKFYLLMGADSFGGFLNWSNPEKIVSECEIVVAGRNGENITQYESDFEKRFNKKITYFNLNTSLSSSYVKELLKLGLDCREFLPKGVNEYIVNNNLYKGDKYYCYLQKCLKPERLKHVAGVAYLSEKYAKKIGENADKAHIAGLLHDVAKYMNEKDFPQFSYPKEITGNVPKRIVHQFLGAHVAKCELGICDEQVLNAIRWHTTGRINMSGIEKIVFLADFLEPSRNYGEVDFLRKEVDKNFENGFKLTLKRLLVYLENSGQTVHELTRLACEYYNSNDKK